MLPLQDHGEFVHALFDILHMGNGLQDMLALAETHLLRPVHLYDINYNLLAVSPKAELVRGHISEGSGQAFLNDSETARMKKYDVLNDINHHREAFVARDKDYPSICWLLCAVRIKNAFVGYLISPTRPDVTTEELAMMTQLSHAISIEMQKSNMFAYKTGLKYSYFFNNLIEGRFESEEIVRSRLEVLDKPVYPFIHIICISAPDALHRNDFEKPVVERARSCFRNCIYTTYHNDLVLLVSEKNTFSETEKMFADFFSFIHTHGLCAGVSQEFFDILQTPAHYRAAVQALEIGLEMKLEKRVFFSEELLFHQLLHSADRDQLNATHYHLYDQIKEQDRLYNTDFLPTIRAYLDNDRNSTKAAEALHIHRTTFFYRVKKMEELWNISFTNCKMLFLMEVSFRIDDFLRLGPLTAPGAEKE